MRRSVSLCSVFLLTCLALTSVGCNLNNEGDDPPRGLLYFPTALMLSAQTPKQAPRFLYLVNSNFDLRYNAGSVQAFDLDALGKVLALVNAKQLVTVKSGKPEHAALNDAIRQPLLHNHGLDPARDASLASQAIEAAAGGVIASCATGGSFDCQIPWDALLVDEALVPSFATGIAASPDHSHLYITNRSVASLTFIDTREQVSTTQPDALLSCSSGDRHCDPEHQRGDPLQNPQNLRYPAEAIGLTTGNAADLLEPDQLASGGGSAAKGDFVLVAHRGGQVSLFLEQAESGGKVGPTLVDVLSGLIVEPTGIAFDKRTQRAYLSVWDRLGTAGYSQKLLDRVGVTLNLGATQQSFLYDADALTIDGISLQLDTRAIVFPDQLPGQALVVSREPAALVWVDVPQTQLATTDLRSGAVARRTVPVGAGPSRLTLGQIGDRPVVVVSCFDARKIYVIDVMDGEVLSIVHNLSGPFELAIDSARKLLYVADFRSSVVRVLDLSPVIDGASKPPTTASVIATIGAPRPVQEFQ